MKEKKELNVQPNLTLLGEQLPRIDVTERVMTSLRGENVVSRSNGQSKHSRIWYVPVITVVVILACGFGYAASSWQLFTPNGSVVFEYRNYLPGDEPDREIDTKMLRDMLAEGEAAVFYIRERDQYIGLANERQYTNYDQFAQAAGTVVPQREIGNGWEYQNGSLMHDLHFPADQSWGEASAYDNISYQQIPLGEKIGYYATYVNAAGNRIAINGTLGERGRIMYTKLIDLEMIKVSLNGIEAFYIQSEESNTHRIVWAEGESDQSIYYELSSSGEITREQLTEVALDLVKDGMNR
ncbi:hypothetical protein D3P08_01605 [Paenibacillus nanensis]|uniref:DUF4367 domain-containing protein n=1 Tax=Paenibacillus nanensis TaxID=393251 RepID=A0A3A1VIK1_9BACL|nr:hypothetical protein [Paenibacillus nanensis]RIX60291.1 hypothetical protein D3P08_01605 [Paenibacillus nanensis]